MDRKSNIGTNKPADLDKSLLNKLSFEIKILLFKVCSMIMKEDERSVPVYALSIIIQTLQTCYFSFNRKIYHAWLQNNVAQELNAFFGYLLISPQLGSFSGLVAIMYLLLALIIMILMIMFILSYTFAQGRSYSWPIFILRQLVFLFTTILYIPTMDVFFTMIACESDNGTYQHQLYPEQCWSGVHMVHGIVAIFSIIIFYLIMGGFTLLYNEQRITNDPISRQNSRCLLVHQSYILIAIICYTFMSTSNDYFQIVILFFGSASSLYILHVKKPFHNRKIQSLWSILATINMWGVLLLATAKYTEGVLVYGTVFSYIIGLPLIISAILLTNTGEYSLQDKLLDNTQNILQIYKHKPNHILVDAFVNYHRLSCTQVDCYMKTKSTHNQRIHKPREDISDKELDFLMIIQEDFMYQIRRDPTNIFVKFQYAFFLLDFMKSKQQALNEFVLLEQQTLSLDQEFVIYRYKIIIEDSINQQQNENMGNLDIVSELAFQNNLRQMQNKIERATLMHMDFWNQLQEESPDLTKLNQIGAKINIALTQVEQLWTRMNKQSQNLPKAMKLYGKFIMEVLQDKDLADELLDRARNLHEANVKMRKLTSIQMVSSEDIQFEPLPTIMINTSTDKFASISNVNLASCNLLGCGKMELLNRKINTLMPNIYAKVHDYHIERAIRAQDQKVSKERVIYVKTKNNYIQPCFVNIKILQSFDINVQIVAQFRVLKQFKPTCYIIIDEEYNIDSISAGCIQLINLDVKKLLHKKMYITELFPHFKDQMDEFRQKNGGRLTFRFQEQEDAEDHHFICFSNEILNENNDQVTGYVIRLEIIADDQKSELGAKKEPSTFQFKYNHTKNLHYQGEFAMDNNSAKVDQTILWEEGLQSSIMTHNNHMTSFDQKSLMKSEQSDDQGNKSQLKIDYADDIKTQRLWDNRIQDIDDKDDHISEDEDYMQNSIFQNQAENEVEVEFQINDQNSVFKSRKNLSNALNSNTTPSIIRKMTVATNIIILGLVVVSFVDFFLTLQSFSDIQDTIDLFQIAGNRNSALGSVQTNIQDLILLNMKAFITPPDEQTIRSQLNQSINAVNQYTQALMLSSVTISNTLEQYATQNIIPMEFGSFNQSYDIYQATQQLISKALNVRDMNLSAITQSDSNVYFIFKNGQNAFSKPLRLTTQEYILSVQSKCVSKALGFQVILGIGTSILGIGFCILSIVLIGVTKVQENILALFLDIPDKTVKYLYNRTENFISSLQVGESDDMLSEIEEYEKDEQEQLNRSLKGKKKKKKFRNARIQSNYMVAFAVTTVILEIFFILNFLFSNQVLTEVNSLTMELNGTVRAQSTFRLGHFSQRQLYLNQTQMILYNNPYTTVTGNIQVLYDLHSTIHEQHALNLQNLNQAYINAFDEMTWKNPCPILQQQQGISYDECKSIAGGSVYEGFNVLWPRYFESLRTMLTYYDQVSANASVNFTAIAGFAPRKIVSDPIRNNILNLNNFPESYEQRQIQDKYDTGFWTYINQQFIAGISSMFDNTKTQRLALFIVFEALLFVIYFILWLPLLMQLTRDIWRTTNLIIMIPLRVIQRIKSIKQFIKDNVN